jgi:glycerol-3-phosphate O-acyltransferase
VRETLLQDREIDAYTAGYAAERKLSLLEARQKIERYLDEIVPYFNIFSYYKLGAGVARGATRFCYELVFDSEGLEAARKRIPRGAVVVYVANHRSNADYIVLSVGAMRQVALSYAVGEWALVWPLDALFRSFGSYFVRRGEKDPLYHRVLERYIQVVASRGLTTAFFLEGGLSRDGALRPPKIGLLDYLVGMLRSEPEREIVFLPVGLNYDRVLEDRNLLASRAPPTLGEKVRSFGRILRRVPGLLLAVPARAALRARRKFGYAAVSFGEPVPLRTLLPDAVAAANLPRSERLPQMAILADRLLRHVWRAIPATPVALTARALLSGPQEVSELRRKVREEIAELRADGRPLGFGLAFESVREGSRRHAAAGDDGDKTDLDAELLAAEEAERAVDLALVLLRRRELIRVDGTRVTPQDTAVLAYYARSLDPPAVPA